MHEMVLAENILKITLEKAREHDLEVVEEVSLVSGELMGVVFETLEFCFQVLSEDTIAAEAELNCKKVKARIKCQNCGYEFFWKESGYKCPECKAQNGKMISGKEFYVASITGDNRTK